jgi:prepilin-type N-terminal cleavage/methylation domain-containing protein
MKLSQLANSARIFRPRAFTLAEVMIAMSVFTMLMIALASCQLFGLRLYRVSGTKLSATADGRKVLNQVREKIRQGKLIFIGTGDATGFTNAPDSALQMGNALQIHFTTNRAVYARYYLDPEDDCLKTVTSSHLTPEIICRYVTNRIVFQAENFRGTVLTNDDNNRVIKMTLEFYQWQFPMASLGQDGLYDYFRVQTRVTRRLIE